jgi:hypothetical protein
VTLTDIEIRGDEASTDFWASWQLALQTLRAQQLALALDAMIDAEDRAGLSRLVRELRGTPESQSVRAALINLIVSRCPGQEPGTFDREAIAAELGRLQRAGALKLLNPSDIRTVLPS